MEARMPEGGCSRMTCPLCGSRTSASVRQCPICGTRLDTASDPVRGNAADDGTATSYTPPAALRRPVADAISESETGAQPPGFADAALPEGDDATATTYTPPAALQRPVADALSESETGARPAGFADKPLPDDEGMTIAPMARSASSTSRDLTGRGGSTPYIPPSILEGATG